MRFILIMLVVFLAGCANSITFFQSTRASLTIETSGVDVNKPVQGNFGYKNRTFIYNPKMADGKELMSLISDAQFNVVDNAEGDEVITFRSSLISGDAASSLSGNKLVEAVEAISGANVIPSFSDLAKASKKTLCGLSASEYAKAKSLITGTPYKTLSTSEMTTLENNTQVGKLNYKEKLHDELSSLLKADGDCA